MVFEFLNSFGKNFKGGKIKFIEERNSLFFHSEELLFFISISKKKIKSFDFGYNVFIISFDIQIKGILVIILYENGHLVFFDIKKNKIVGRLTFKNQILKIKWSPFNQTFVCLTLNCIQIWQLRDFSSRKFYDFFLIYNFKIDCGKIYDLDWDKSGKHLILGGNDGTVRIFHLKKKGRARSCVFLKYEHEIQLIRFNINIQEFWTLTSKNILKKYKFLHKNLNYKTGKINKKKLDISEYSYILKQETGLIVTSELDPESNCVIQGYANGILTIFEIPSEKNNTFDNSRNKNWRTLIYPYRRIEFFKVEISSISFSKNLDLILLGSRRHGKIFILNKLNLTTILTQNHSNSAFTSLAISHNDKLVCTGNSTGIIQLWSLNFGMSLMFFRNHFNAILKVVFLKKTSRFILSCSIDGIIKLFDLKKLSVIKIMETVKYVENFKFFDINYSNKLIVSSSDFSDNIYLWSLKTGNLKEIIPNGDLKIFDLRFDDKKNKIVLSNRTGIIKIWNIEIFPNVYLKITCKTIYVNSELLAVNTIPVLKQFVFLSNQGRLLILDSTNFKFITSLRCFSKKTLSNGHKKIDSKYNYIIECSSDGKYILLNSNSESWVFLTSEIKSLNSFKIINQKSVFEKLEKNFYIKYFDKKKKSLKNNIIDIKSFNKSKKWIYLNEYNLIIIGSNYNKFKDRGQFIDVVLKRSEIYLRRLIQILLFEKKQILLHHLVRYCPVRTRIKIASLLLTNSVVKHILG